MRYFKSKFLLLFLLIILPNCSIFMRGSSDTKEGVKEPLYLTEEEIINLRKEIEQYNKVLKKNPNDSDSYYDLGYLNIKLRECDEAIKNYKKFIELEPNSSRGMVNLAASYLCKKDFDTSIKYLKQIIVNNPNDLVSNANLGFVYINQKKYDEAIKQLEKTLLIESDLQCCIYNIYNGLAEAYKGKKDFNKAIEFYKKGITLAPNKAESYYDIARIYSLNKDIKNTIENLKQAIIINIKYKKSAQKEKDFELLKENKLFIKLINKEEK